MPSIRPRLALLFIRASSRLAFLAARLMGARRDDTISDDLPPIDDAEVAAAWADQRLLRAVLAGLGAG